MRDIRSVGGWCSILLVALALTLGVGVGTHAEAKSPPDELTQRIEAKAEEAARHFAAKDFAKAVRAYVEAYQIAQRPSELLYNIAFIYDRKLKEREMAGIYYKKYAAAADADPELVEKAIVRIGELRREQATQSDPSKPGTPTPRVTPPASAKKTEKGGSKAGAIATLVGGSAVMLVAGGLYVGAVVTHSDFQTAPASERADLADAGRALALSGDVLMGVGAVATLVGIIMYASQPERNQTSNVNVGAMVLGGGLGLTVGGSL